MEPISSNLHEDSIEYEMIAEYNIGVPMRDGVDMSTVVYRPDAPGRFPVLLCRTPYGKVAEYCLPDAALVRKGYVVVVQDVRGRYDSDGKFYPFVNERSDGIDAQSWCAAQPWSNGAVGTYGISYGGITQLLPATQSPPGLKAMYLQVTSTDFYNHWFYPSGAFALQFSIEWGGIHVEPRTCGLRALGDWNLLCGHLPIAKATEALGHRPAHYTDWVQHPTYDAYWKQIRTPETIAQIKVPGFFVGGWYDIFIQGMFEEFTILRNQSASKAARAGTRILVGPWLHFAADTPRQIGLCDYGPKAVVDIMALKTRWFDYWLKGIDNGLSGDAPVRIFVMGDNVWRDEFEWPLSRTRFTNWYFHSAGRANSLYGDGLLDEQPPVLEESFDHFVYDPCDPAPSVGGKNCCWPETHLIGPYDQRSVERRDDVLVYTSKPLQGDLEITGPITASIFVSTSAVDTDFTVKLVDVYPDGRAVNICDGIVVGRYRDSREQWSLLVPNHVYEMKVDIGVTSQVFKRGHCVRVEVSSSNFPRFARNLNTGEPLGDSTNLCRANQTLFHDRLRCSHLVLPVIPREETR